MYSFPLLPVSAVVQVNFNEPLSLLQRLCEVELEYCDILNKAAKCEDSLEQLALVAAFTVSSYSSTVSSQHIARFLYEVRSFTPHKVLCYLPEGRTAHD